MQQGKRRVSSLHVRPVDVGQRIVRAVRQRHTEARERATGAGTAPLTAREVEASTISRWTDEECVGVWTVVAFMCGGCDVRP